MSETFPENWPNYKSHLFGGESLTTDELIAFVHKDEPSNDHEYYLNKWKNVLLRNSSYTGFNAASFFVGSLWCLFRKLYLLALIVFLIESFGSVLFYSIVFTILNESSGLFNLLQNHSYLIWIIITRTVLGFLANLMYLNQSTKYILKSRLIESDILKRSQYLMINGGTNVGAVIGGIILGALIRFLLKYS